MPSLTNLQLMKKLKRRVRKRRLAKMLIVIASLIGFLVQVTQMSILYFEYRTTTQVSFVLNKKITLHSIVLCVRYSDILDRVKLFNETGIVVDDVTDIGDAMSQQAKLTVKQMFDYTPQSDQVIDGCFYRLNNWNLTTANRTDCNYLFQVTRYLTQEFMCYEIIPVHLKVISTDAVTLSHFKQFVVYDITLRKVFRYADHVLPISVTEGFPYLSRSFSDVAILRKTSSASTVNDYNLINIFPNEFEIRRLEKPYDTACQRRNQDEYYECRRECLVTEFEKLNRLPRTEILIESDPMSYDILPVSTTDLEDPDFGRDVDVAYNRCHNNCDFTPCQQHYTKTTFRTLVFKEFPLVLSCMSPTEADVRTESQARMSFVEYFSFICGCFGTWFGVSFFSLYRVQRLVKRERKGKESLVSDTSDYHSEQTATWRQIREEKWASYAHSLEVNPIS